LPLLGRVRYACSQHVCLDDPLNVRPPSSTRRIVRHYTCRLYGLDCISMTETVRRGSRLRRTDEGVATFDDARYKSHQILRCFKFVDAVRRPRPVLSADNFGSRVSDCRARMTVDGGWVSISVIATHSTVQLRVRRPEVPPTMACQR